MCEISADTLSYVTLPLLYIIFLGQIELQKQVTYNCDTSLVTVTVNSKPVPQSAVTNFYNPDSKPSEVLQKVSSAQTCIGNSDLDVSERPPFSDNCDVLIFKPNFSSRCPACSKYRKCLQKQILRQKQSTSSRVDQSSRVQYCNLNYAELLERSRNVSKKVHTEQVQCNRLRKQLDEIIRKHAVDVDAPTSELCHSTVQSALDRFENGSLRKLFLEQQLKANNLKNKSSMRWHPSVIRWCLVIHSKSKSAYDYIRTSSVLDLPSDRTLRDYIAYRPLETGTQTQEITSLAAQHGSQDVSLLFDEMKVKEGLVYCPYTGKLTGYVDCLESDTLLDITSKSAGKIATHALAFQIRGLKSSFQGIVATYATCALNAEGLYLRFWETVASLELVGFRVRIAVSDGAATNRKFYNLHKSDFPGDPVTYRAKNKFAADGRTIYFASDTCHLVKTTRNCMERSGPKSHRHLVVSILCIICMLANWGLPSKPQS